MADGSVKIEVLLDDSKVSGGVKKVEGRLSGIAGTAKRGLATVGKLAGALGLVGLAYKGIDMVKNSLDGAIDRYDTLNNFPRVMAQIGFDADTSQKAIDRLSDGIQGLPTRLDEVAATAQSIAIMTGDLDLAVDTTLALNNAFLASGASAQDAQRGLDQYVQMLAKGEVDLQSWRTLQETMPYALRKTAEAFGFTGESATNDFYDALKSGEITMDEFNAKLIELDQAQGGFAETAQTASGGIKTAWTNLGTWIVMGIADIIAAIDEAMGGVGSIEGAINGLKPIVQGVFGWIANTAIPAVAEAIRFVIDLFKEWGPSIDEIKNAFAIAFETIQSIVVPIITEVVNFIMEIWGGLVAWWQEHGEMISQTVQNFMTVILTIMQVVWPIIRFLVVDTWEAIKNVIQGAIDVITGIIQFFAALLTGDFSAMWDAIKQIFTGALQAVWGLINLWFIGKILKIGKSLAKGLQNVLKNMWNAIKNVFSTGVNAARNVVNAGFNFIRNIINTVMNTVRNIISRVWNAIRSVISGVINSIRSVISNGFNAARNIVSNVANSIRNTIRNIFNSLRGIVSNAFNGVRNAVRSGMRGALNIIKGMFSSFRNAGRNIVTSIANGIKGAIGKITGAIGSVASRIRNFLPFSPAKEGPLKDIMNVQIAESIAEAIRKGRNSAVKEMDKLASDLFETAQPKRDLLTGIRGYTPNAVLSGYIPNTVQVTQQLIGRTKTITNNNRPVIHIEKIENYSEHDIPRILEESAWILSREDKRL